MIRSKSRGICAELRSPRSLQRRSYVRSNAGGSLADDLVQLKALKNDRLVQLAIACGTPCSGTKDVLSRGLLDGIRSTVGDPAALQSGAGMSIVSIDMGIRNLAFSHLRMEPGTIEKRPQSINLDSWQRIDVSTGAVYAMDAGKAKTKAVIRGAEEAEAARTALKETFEPTVYAERAYHLISRLLEEHRPTHVLLERQRFRSGGGPAVQEWTLRVGMFEYMLYATLHTLKAKGVHGSVVVPVLPPTVNRYWIAELEKYGVRSESKPTSVAMKKFKIEHVKSILETKQSIGRDLLFSSQASGLAVDFLSKLKGGKQPIGTQSISKLDDLSDCLLQGLGWIAWQEHRRQLRSAMEKGTIESYNPFAA